MVSHFYNYPVIDEICPEKTGMKIDQPSSEGGTSSTGNIVRSCFMNKNDLHGSRQLYHLNLEIH